MCVCVRVLYYYFLSVVQSFINNRRHCYPTEKQQVFLFFFFIPPHGAPVSPVCSHAEPGFARCHALRAQFKWKLDELLGRDPAIHNN